MTPYQSEYPSPTLPPYRGKEENGKTVEDKKERATRPTKRREQLGLQKGIGPALDLNFFLQYHMNVTIAFILIIQ